MIKYQIKKSFIKVKHFFVFQVNGKSISNEKHFYSNFNWITWWRV